MPSTPGTLAFKVRAKYPGAYDDLDDAALEAAVTSKHPGVYDDLPRSTLPTRPVSAEDFVKPSTGWPAKLGDIALGALKGLGSTAAGIAEMGANAGMVPGVLPAAFNPAMRNPAFTRAEELTTATNTDQRIGKGLETAAELAVPAFEAGKAGLALAKAAPSAARKALPAVAEALASERPLLAQARSAIAKKILSSVLGEPASVNAGGRIVKGSKLTDTEALAGVLDELRVPAAAQPKVTLPPQPMLPPSYTPRTSAPNVAPAVLEEANVPVPSLGPDARTTSYTGPERRGVVRSAADEDALYAASRADRERMAARFKQTSPGALENQRMAAERTAADAAPPAAKRAYFLKSPEELAAVADEAVAPSGSISPEDLPAAWRQHTGQDLFPVTGEEGKAVAAALKAELQERGMSVGEAMARVSANKSIPTKERAQLIKALNQSYAQR